MPVALGALQLSTRLLTQYVERNLMSAQVLGVLVAAISGALASWRFAAVWSAPRVSALRAAIIGGLAGGAFNPLLQALGAGDLGFASETGTIDWPPVVATMVSGGLCGFIVILALGLIRMGSRRPFG